MQSYWKILLYILSTIIHIEKSCLKSVSVLEGPESPKLLQPSKVSCLRLRSFPGSCLLVAQGLEAKHDNRVEEWGTHSQGETMITMPNSLRVTMIKHMSYVKMMSPAFIIACVLKGSQHLTTTVAHNLVPFPPQQPELQKSHTHTSRC